MEVYEFRKWYDCDLRWSLWNQELTRFWKTILRTYSYLYLVWIPANEL
jgi:hypothetical protein